MKKTVSERRVRRQVRVRARVRGTATCPRLSVFRSAKHFAAQLVDDVAGKTVAAVHDTQLKASGKPMERAKALGLLLGEKAKAVGVSTVVFDRGHYSYHGRVQSFADGAREAGLIF